MGKFAQITSLIASTYSECNGSDRVGSSLKSTRSEYCHGLTELVGSLWIGVHLTPVPITSMSGIVNPFCLFAVNYFSFVIIARWLSNALYEQDNTPSHRTIVASTWFKKYFSSFFCNPSDINLEDNLWDSALTKATHYEQGGSRFKWQNYLWNAIVTYTLMLK